MNVAKFAKRGLFLAGVLSISAASAFAQSLISVPYEESFSEWSAGLVYGQNKAGWDVNADDASYITNNLAGYTAQGNVLALNTEGQTLEAEFNQAGTETDGTALWVDALVKMVVSEDDPASIPADVRTAVFLNASSNLVIYHGVVIADPESGSNIIVPTNTVTDVEINPDSFCRLTIEVNGDSEGTGQFFKFYIDGNVVEAPAGIAYAEVPDDISDTASAGVWFAAATATTGNCFVESLAFQGTGYVDDISVKRDSPLTSTWQLTVAATSNGSITTNGVALAAGSYDIDTRASITLVATPTNGYAVTSFTTNNVEVGATSVVFANMAAEAEVTVAATFALQAAAVVNGNGDVVAYYDSVAAAVAAANGLTVKLLAELDLTGANPNLVIPVGTTTTLDLNGFSIRGDNDGDIQVLGTLTFKDSATYGENDTPASLYSTTAYASGHATGLVKVSGTGSFTMESGVIDADKFLDPANEGQFAVVYFDEATVTINGGTIKAGWYALSSNGTVTNGQAYETTVVVTGGSLISSSDYAIYMADAGSVTISGTNTVVDGAAGAICTRRGTLNISGGQFATAGTGNVGSWSDGTGNLSPNVLINVPANYAATYGDQACAVTISGGDFTAAQGIACLSLGNSTVGSIAVRGGSFSAAVPEEYCADGYIPADLGNGKFGVEAGYTVTFKNYDGTVLFTTNVAVGATAVYYGATPTKADDAENTYAFAAWDPAITAVVDADQTYTATFTATPIGNPYENSAVAGDYVIVDPLDGATEQLAFGAPVTAANGDVTVPFSAEIIGTGTINSGLYLKVKTELAGAYNTIPAVITVDATEGTGTATFTPPVGATQLFFFGITDTAIAGE